ncbi:hypothetical protein V8C37DRAFT_146240 [Trichoderma ceciliae]
MLLSNPLQAFLATSTTIITITISSKMSSSTPPSDKVLPPPPLKPLPRPPCKPLPPIPFQSKNAPRPDSFTLPPNLDHVSNTLNLANFHHITYHPARGSTPSQIQYWLRADVVLAGLPGEQHVPPGHWPKLVQLAQELSGGRSGSRTKRERRGKKNAQMKEVRLLTAWYVPGEEKDGVEMKVEESSAEP